MVFQKLLTALHVPGKLHDYDLLPLNLFIFLCDLPFLVSQRFFQHIDGGRQVLFGGRQAAAFGLCGRQ